MAIHDSDENIDSSKGEFAMQKCLFWSLPYYIHMYIVCMLYLYNGNVALSNHGKPIWSQATESFWGDGHFVLV